MIIQFPSNPKPSQIRVTSNSVVGKTASIYTGKQQVFMHPGSWWSADVTLPTMTHAEAGVWLSFLTRLRGQYGTFYLPVFTQNRGFRLSGALVAGESQTGSTLLTDNWRPSAKVLSAGDFLTVDDRLYQCVSDSYSDATGSASISVFPELRDPADNADVIVDEPYGLFRLSSNLSNWDISTGLLYGLSFTAVEAI